MSACSIQVPPLRQVPSLHKNESTKTEQKEKKFLFYSSCVNNLLDLAVEFKFRISERVLISF